MTVTSRRGRTERCTAGCEREDADKSDWLADVDDRHPVFAEVTRRLDDLLGVRTSSEVAAHLRVAAISDVEIGFGGRLTSSLQAGSIRGSLRGDECFLDTEVVAIYW